MTIAQIKQRIIDWIKTGIPKNIKSNNVRTLFQELTKKTPDVDNFTLGKIYAIGKNNNLDRELLSTEINPVQYTVQELTPEQQAQALNNLGITSILIEGKKYSFYKKSGNSQPYPQAGDLAILGWYSDNTFKIMLEYVSGNPQIFTSWKVISYLKTPEWRDMLDGGVMNLPPMKRGDSMAFRIKNEFDSLVPDGSFRLGGLNGVVVGHNAVLICMSDSLGGGYAANGHRFLITNNNISTTVRFIQNPSQLPIPGVRNVIFISIDNYETYYYNQSTGEYDLIGEAVKGYLENPTTFIDTNESEVIPSADKIYLDVDTNKIYRWNGLIYEEISKTDKQVIFTYNLPASGENGILYIRTSDNTQWRWQVGGSVQYPESTWVQLGGGSDLSDYYTKTETDNLIEEKANDSEVVKVIDQSLTLTEQAQARENIGVTSSLFEEVFTLDITANPTAEFELAFMPTQIVYTFQTNTPIWLDDGGYTISGTTLSIENPKDGDIIRILYYHE